MWIFIGMLGMFIRVVGSVIVTGMVFYSVYLAVSESLKVGGIMFMWAVAASWVVVIVSGVCIKISDTIDDKS